MEYSVKLTALALVDVGPHGVTACWLRSWRSAELPQQPGVGT